MSTLFLFFKYKFKQLKATKSNQKQLKVNKKQLKVNKKQLKATKRKRKRGIKICCLRIEFVI